MNCFHLVPLDFFCFFFYKKKMCACGVLKKLFFNVHTRRKDCAKRSFVCLCVTVWIKRYKSQNRKNKCSWDGRGAVFRLYFCYLPKLLIGCKCFYFFFTLVFGFFLDAVKESYNSALFCVCVCAFCQNLHQTKKSLPLFLKENLKIWSKRGTQLLYSFACVCVFVFLKNSVLRQVWWLPLRAQLASSFPSSSFWEWNRRRWSWHSFLFKCEKNCCEKKNSYLFLKKHSGKFLTGEKLCRRGTWVNRGD